MAKHVLWNLSLIVNGVDLSDHVQAIDLEVGQTKVDNAPIRSAQAYTRPGVLTVTDPVLTFYQDYATGKTYQTFMALWQNQTVFNLVIKADAGARALTNPEWTIPVYVLNMPVMVGKRGDAHMAPITCTVAGLVTIATS